MCRGDVFPTRVGVFPRSRWTRRPSACLPHASGGVSHDAIRNAIRSWGLPHASGGVSKSIPTVEKLLTSSPREWGCFQRPGYPPVRKPVFPT